ncbi:unnamed protein product [Hermetia illucens]|uniref:Integrase zinc-binding domain-containing protein n=1 Tax=Hermetia illucens TaxID=343691 RepID=A0A7R8UBS7_HERIL|nr:unnamed protein product [Hermetia illucens]
MVERPFESLIKEARSISVYDGNNEKTALQPWLVEVNDIILLTNAGPQRAYIFNIIMSKIQGPARQVIQRIMNPNWESMRAALIANFGVTGEGYLLINNNKLYFNYACPEEINHSEELVEDNNWEKLFQGLNQEESAALKKILKENKDLFYKEEEENTSNVATIHSGIEERLDFISIKEGIVNIYRTQILIVEQKVKEFELLNGKRKIYIDKSDIENNYFVTDILRRHLPEKGTVGIHSELSDHEYNIVQLQIVELYSNNRNLKFIKCTSKAIDLINEEQCYGKIKEIHEKGNHRGIQENFEEIKHLYYYKKIIQLITKYINNCEVCNLAKYDRNPVKVEFKLIETPNDINQIVHLDVFLIGKRMFFTGYIRERNSCLGKPRKLVAEKEFNMVNVKEFLRQESIEIHFTSPKSHTGNSDISRAHSSLLEHIRTLTLTERDMSISEKVLKATEFYNTTIHSTINCKPLDVQLGQVDKSKIAQLMQEKKEKWVSYCNKNREQQQNITHDKVYIKNYVNERYKEEPKYRKARGQKTKIFHKGNLILFLLGIITVLLQIKSTLAQPSLQVEEVHSATGLLLIKKGNEKLIRDYKRIYHKIDLRQYELALLELEKNIADPEIIKESEMHTYVEDNISLKEGGVTYPTQPNNDINTLESQPNNVINETNSLESPLDSNVNKIYPTISLCNEFKPNSFYKIE